MFKRIFSRISKYLPQILALLFILAFAVYGWTEPASAPPGGNAPTPLNVGSAGQSKSGGLILNTGGAATGLIVDKGDTLLRGDIKIVKNGVECSVYSDCDADGKTYFSGDCDESCSGCYLGSTNYTATSDGKDQNCNGVA